MKLGTRNLEANLMAQSNGGECLSSLKRGAFRPIVGMIDLGAGLGCATWFSQGHMPRTARSRS